VTAYLWQRQGVEKLRGHEALWISLAPAFSRRSVGSFGLRLVLRGLLRRARIERPVTPHTLRHTAATHMLRGGADLLSVQKFLGHASLKSTERYTRLGLPDVKQAHERALAAAWAGESA
jgi:site-specific recombinase XerD